MNKQLGAVVAAWGLFAGMTGIALADLKAVDPGPYTAATGYFPAWYQDNNDLSLELCQSKALSPTGGYLCTLIPEAGVFDDTLPMVFPNNWPSELFWFLAETTIPAGAVNGYELEVYVAGIEAAFAGGPPQENDQVAFARIRIRASIPNNRRGVYTITHPYGVETIDVTQGGRRAINLTRDIGIATPGDFTGALTGDVGPFLRSASGNVTAINPETGDTEIFIGDPNLPGPVTGGVNGVNYVEISGPAGVIRSDQFVLSGKILDSRPATPVTVERSTYSRDGTGNRITVFANSNANSDVCYRETLAMVPGTPPSPCLVNLTRDGQGYFFASNPFAQSIPPFVVVTASDPAGLTRATALSSPLQDIVKIGKAEYYRDTQTLAVEASSSDEVAIPDLAAAGFGRLTKLGTLQRLTVTGMSQPPAHVTVKSAAGGADSELVTVLATAPVANLPPVGVEDSASTSPGTFVDISVLTNDSDPEDNLPLAVASVTQPAAGQGSVAINPDGVSVRYTPPATVDTAFTASFTYVAADSEGMLSDPTAVNVSVSASNRPPVANPDIGSTTAGTAITLNVLANDSDPENNTPLDVTAVTQPASGQGSVVLNANNTLTYTPPATVASTFTAAFTYTVADSLGASAVGNVSVTVGPTAPPPAAITVGTATVRAGSGNRYTWQLSGSTTLANTNLTIQVTTTDDLQTLGTVTPNRRNGSWSLTVRNSTAFVPTPSPTATITATATGESITVPVQVQ